jgi:hypothetical protein
MSHIDRYLKIMTWLRNRYTFLDESGRPNIVISIGGKPSRYMRLEEAFFDRYMGSET